MSPWTWLGVAVLGGLGTTARFLLDGAIGQRINADFPLGTFVVNVSGALLLGLLTGLALTGNALLLAGTATLGSYTTFSTWMLESHRLSEDGDPYRAGLNLALSVAAGVGAAALGHAIGAGL